MSEITPRPVPRANRFALGTFKTIAQAETMLRVAETLRDVDESVLRASGVIMGNKHYDSTEMTAYALSVMADNETTLQDIKDITAIIEAMRELEALDR